MMYTQNKITKFKGNSKYLHKLITELTRSKVENPLPEDLSDEELAEHFAIFFIAKIEIIRNKLNNYKLYNPTENSIMGKLSEFKSLSADEIRNSVRKMQIKSCELDYLPTHILENHIDSFIPVLTKIVNLSLKSDVLLEDWKIAILRPLLKKCGLDLIDSNYRPVSNLPFTSKLVEQAIMNQFDTHCELNGITPAHQSAYKWFYSCETALIKIVNDTLWAVKHKNITMLVIIDLSTAFDTVNHKVLLEVLQKKLILKCFNSVKIVNNSF